MARAFYLDEIDWYASLELPLMTKRRQAAFWKDLSARYGFLCPRCEGIHVGVVYRPLRNPIHCGGTVLTHYAWCPNWGEPLLSSLGAEGIVVATGCPEDDDRRPR